MISPGRRAPVPSVRGGAGARLALVAILCVASATLPTSAASAHALYRSSIPERGSTLGQAPAEVTVTFTEQPDLALSSIAVLDTTGRDWAAGDARAHPEDPLTLVVPLEPLPDGVYSVNWRVVSVVDGHLTSGAFAFGVGVDPEAVTAPATQDVVTQPGAGAAGRAFLALGIALLLGAAWGALALGGAAVGAVRWALGAGWVTAGGGVVLLSDAQRRAVGVDVGAFLETSIGQAAAARGAMVVLAGAAIALAVAGPGGLRRPATIATGFAAAALAFVHVSAGHAAAGAAPGLNVPLQWIHVLAMGSWLGGLAVLLAALRELPEPADRLAAAQRFSTFALAAIAVVAVTGAVRGAASLGTAGDLLSTRYGQILLIKAAALLVIATLGALNRYRILARTDREPRGLRRVGIAELAVAGVVIAASGVLSQTAPPGEAAEPAPPQEIAVEGSDFGTTVRVRLEVEPGSPGPNRFTLRLADYDRGEPADADRVTLRFILPARPALAETALPLEPAAEGVWRGEGANLSQAGTWQVLVLIERGAQTVQVPLELPLAVPEPRITVDEFPGLPTVTTVDFGAERTLQVYLDPGTPGVNQFHTTFFDGPEEMPIEEVSITTTGPDADRIPLDAERFGPGHFIGPIEVTGGTWTFAITALTAAGETLEVSVEIEVASS